MPNSICRHIRTNGLQCKAPALSGQTFCYFHTRLYQRHRPFRHTPETAGYLMPGQHIQLAPLEDRESIQVAISQVINALATGQLEPRRATALLYGLQLASANASRLHLISTGPEAVRSFQTTPDGIDLAGPELDAPELANPTLDPPDPSTLELHPPTRAGHPNPDADSAL